MQIRKQLHFIVKGTEHFHAYCCGTLEKSYMAESKVFIRIHEVHTVHCRYC